MLLRWPLKAFAAMESSLAQHGTGRDVVGGVVGAGLPSACRGGQSAVAGAAAAVEHGIPWAQADGRSSFAFLLAQDIRQGHRLEARGNAEPFEWKRERYV